MFSHEYFSYITDNCVKIVTSEHNYCSLQKTPRKSKFILRFLEDEEKTNATKIKWTITSHNFVKTSRGIHHNSRC